MPTVDLPAHNVRNQYGAYPITIVGGPECLATPDTTSYIQFDPSKSGFYVGATADGMASTAQGFGTWNPPAEATVEDIRLVAQGWVASSTPYPPGTNDGSTNNPLVNRPSILVDYTGAAYLAGYNLSTFPVGPIDPPTDVLCAVQLNHTELILGSDPTARGLTPVVTPDYIMGYSGPTITITYLAIRITYSLPPPPPPPEPEPVITGQIDETRRVFSHRI